VGKALRVSVHHCKALRNLQMLGDMDCYVSATLLPSRSSCERTVQIAGGGTAPSWDGINGSEMLVNVDTEDETLLVEVWNEGMIGNDLVGSVELPLAALASKMGKQASHALDTGGEISITIARDQSSASALVGKTLVLDVHKGDDLQDTQMIGDMDPYVVATMLPSMQVVQQTAYVAGGGCFPTWLKDGTGRMELPVGKGDTGLLLELMNKNITVDDLIGSCQLQLNKEDLKFGKQAWRSLSCQQASGGGSSEGGGGGEGGAGEGGEAAASAGNGSGNGNGNGNGGGGGGNGGAAAVTISKGRLEFTVTRGTGSGGAANTGRAISIQVHAAKCLQKVQMFGAQDPYVKALLLPQRAVSAQCGHIKVLTRHG
jgi:uncharacterized protein YciI